MSFSTSEDGDPNYVNSLCFATPPYTIPPELLSLSTSSKEVLSNLEYTDLLRLATQPEGKQHILSLYNVNGLKLKKEYKLYPHQIKALRWMRSKEENGGYGMKGGILSLYMGLGKTLCALTHIDRKSVV